MNPCKFIIITKALTEYSGNVENLFTVETWKILLIKAITGESKDAENENDERLTKLAVQTIEQITSSKYSQKISKILASRLGEMNRNGIDAQEFLKLCEEHNARKSNKELSEVTDEVSNMEIDEEEDKLSEIVQISGLRMQNSHTYRPRRGLSKSNLIHALERPPIIDQFNENIYLIPSHPVFELLPIIDEDETIKDEILSSAENLESNPIPYKRARYSFSPDDDKNGNKLRTSFLPQSIMRPIGGGDSHSVRPNRPIHRTSKNFYDDDDNDDDDDKKRSANLPKPIPPEEPILKNLPTTEEEITNEYPHPLSCPDLNLAMFDAMREVMSQPEDIVVSDFKKTITKNNLKVYNEGEWLEDPNIDFYLEMIKDRNNQKGSPYPKVYVYHGFFYKLLETTKNFNLVRDTTEEDNIFEYDLVLFPIHTHDHWILIAADFRKKSIYAYDSMCYGFYGENDKELLTIQTYIYQEFKKQKAKNDGNGDGGWKNLFKNPESSQRLTFYEGWDWGCMGNTIPQQANFNDCGVFCLQFAEYLSRDCPFDFEQKHMPYFRKRILFETITKTLFFS